MPTTLTPWRSRRVDGEAAPAAADVEHALARLEVELGADQLELRLLRLLERRGAAREDRAAVGHRGAEEQREELGRQVVVVAHRAGVALAAVAACRAGAAPPAAGVAEGAGRRRGRRRARAGRAPAARAAAAATSSRSEHGVHVVDVELARDVGAAQPELARRAQRVGERVRRAHLEGAARRRWSRAAWCRPRADRERALGQRALQLSKKGPLVGRALRQGRYRARDDGLLRPERGLHQLHAEAIARALTHAGLADPVDRDHGDATACPWR